MRAIVVTADQQRSGKGRDQVPDLLFRLNDARLPSSARVFERTTGDQVQGVIDSGEALVARLTVLQRYGAWNVGIGIDTIEMPLAPSSRAGRGPAFGAARRAVARAARMPGRIAVAGEEEEACRRIETVAMLWAGILARRSPRGWEVSDLLATGISHSEAGVRLGISQSAVTQRAHAAGLLEAERGASLLTDLVEELLAAPED